MNSYMAARASSIVVIALLCIVFRAGRQQFRLMAGRGIHNNTLNNNMKLSRKRPSNGRTLGQGT